MLPMTVGLIFVAFTMMALVVEISLLGVAYRDIATVADLAAESGAAMLSTSAAYDTTIALDEVAAIAEARRVGDMWRSGETRMTVDVGPTRICVTMLDAYRPRTLVFVGVEEIGLRVTGCAAPAAG